MSQAAVIDDQDLICELIKDYCEVVSLGCDGYTHWQAFADADSHRYDMIFLDLKMPDIDGIEALRYLKEMDYRGAVILASGLDSGVIDSARHFGEREGLNVIGYLAKPFSLDDFRSIVADVETSSGTQDLARVVVDEKNSQSPISQEMLHQAVEAWQFYPVFQPQVDSRTMKLCSVECLARWRNDKLGEIPPAVFIPLLEDYGLIDEFTRRFIRDSLVTLEALQNNGLDLSFSFNISARSLSRDFVNDIIALFEELGMPAHKVTLEVTESFAINTSEDALMALTKLRIHGFSLSIDDFGTGYSTIHSLRELPFNEIKIDRGFIHKMHDSESSLAIVKSLVNLSQELGYDLVVEGIETPVQLRIVLGYGDALLQGYFFSRPLEIDDLLAYADQDLSNLFAVMGILDEPETQIRGLAALHFITSSSARTNRAVVSIAEIFSGFTQYSSLDDVPESRAEKDVLLLDWRDLINPQVLEPRAKEYFVVALINTQDIEHLMQIYAFGVDEIVFAQMSPKAMAQKINESYKKFQDERRQSDLLKSSQSVAFQAMTEASEYGRIIQLAKEIVRVSSIDALLATADEYFSEQGIPFALKLYDPRSGHAYGLEMQADIVRKIFDTLAHQGRLYAFNNRMIANGDNCAILIKAMPDDEVKAGRLRDTLATLIEIVEVKWKDLLNTQFIEELDQQISKITGLVMACLASASKELSGVTDSFSEFVFGSFHLLDLNEEQEQYLINKLDDLLINMSVFQTFNDMETMLKRLQLFLAEKQR